MPQIYLCFLWHMHQPFYKDLVTGQYNLPWTRLHALKDYYGMVHMLEEFPKVHQTFNLVPSMMVQVEEYAAGKARDPFLECAATPADALTDVQRDLILDHFFHANPERMINRFPRYAELYEARRAQKDPAYTKLAFGAQDFRDLQVLSQLAWFDQEFLENDPGVVALIRKGRNFDLADQALMLEKQKQILGLVIPAYHKAAQSGQIEISTTPYYHPILPLLCDSDIAAVSHPGVPLPRRFRYPADASRQLQLAREFTTTEFGSSPVGLWPSEGSVSDEVFRLAAEAGFEWAATDSGVLDRTLGRGSGVDGLYRPYRWAREGREIRVLFRDHFLSDLIGFVYSRMDAREAAQDFLSRIRENCLGILANGRDALVPVILDGENAWEYYERNGRPFLRELYRRISDASDMTALTVHEALSRIQPEPLDHIFPGSWINANFDVWIGAEEDNQAWEYLLEARETFDRATGVSDENRRLAFEELLIAEGSDWCWWYGPEHDSPDRPDFDRLYRSHLANVYRALGKEPPEKLSRPILKVSVQEFRQEPGGFIHPIIDGQVTSYFEWLGAGLYRADPRSGAMHGRQFLVREVYYGTDGASVFLRLDFDTHPEAMAGGVEVRLLFSPPDGAAPISVVVHVAEGATRATPPEIQSALRDLLEIAVPLSLVRAAPGATVRFQISLWQRGLPLGSLPHEGWLEFPTTDTVEWAR
ncbi:MAG: glycoside hydrolase [Acidobacteria bacterium]|nr:MAG: glycoside hydrolase [Acidobacteriota bacterium]